MNKSNMDIMQFFDKSAQGWDEHNCVDATLISRYVGLLNITDKHSVLDVACGTGVLTGCLLDANPAKILGIDISQQMIAVAKCKYTDPKVQFSCSDFLCENIGQYDSLIMYNALPHFADRQQLAQCCANAVKGAGLVLICHGSSRDNINACHHGVMHISTELHSAQSEYQHFSKYFQLIDYVDSDSQYYFLMKKI